MEKRPWQRYAAMAFLFTGGLQIAVCRPRLYFYPRNAEAFAPVPVNPLREPGDKGKKLQRLLDEEEII